ncbi:hypothetical protein AAFF_G00293770 [Aldrovandia affinis]|uniref:Uncharacterized protein n=1 Tax=Aldrovandia affinis TaxID=143900 RepID=A0AAD7R9L9_9TELE|nr:hypothetical protein AAFF_G00293770 [Aldrovandia affinis]
MWYRVRRRGRGGCGEEECLVVVRSFEKSLSIFLNTHDRQTSIIIIIIITIIIIIITIIITIIIITIIITIIIIIITIPIIIIIIITIIITITTIIIITIIIIIIIIIIITRQQCSVMFSRFPARFPAGPEEPRFLMLLRAQLKLKLSGEASERGPQQGSSSVTESALGGVFSRSGGEVSHRWRVFGQ